MRVLQCPAILTSLALLSSCSNLRIEKDDVQKIRKVAVAGVLLHQVRPNYAGPGNEEAPSKPIGRQIEDALLREPRSSLPIGKCEETAAAVYADLNTTIERELGWRTASLSELKANAQYRKVLRSSYTLGAAVDEDFDRMCPVEGIGGPWAVESLDLEKRRELLRALGVDALVTAEYDVSWDGWADWTLNGALAAAIRPASVVKISVLGPEREEPVWQDRNPMARSMRSDEYLRMREELLSAPSRKPSSETQLEALAAQRALKNLIDRYKSEAGLVAASR